MHHAPSEGRAGFLRLDFNENTIGCSPRVIRALRKITAEETATYPAYEGTRRRLARYFRVAPQELILTNGADEALKLVSDAFLDSGSRALVVEPTFDMYRFYIGLAGARRVAVRYDDEMRMPLGDLLRALRKGPRVFFLSNPNNPTGTLVGRDALRRILKAARRTLVVVDEAYVEFNGVTVLPWIRRYPNLVVARTFSKAAGLAGLRLGCLLAHRDLIATLHKVQPPFAVNRLALMAGEAAIGDRAHVRRVVREVSAARKLLESALRRLGVKTFPTGANFLLVDFGERGPELVAGLRRRGILLRDRARDFGRPGFVRITIGTRAQMRRLIREIEGLW